MIMCPRSYPLLFRGHPPPKPPRHACSGQAGQGDSGHAVLLMVVGAALVVLAEAQAGAALVMVVGAALVVVVALAALVVPAGAQAGAGLLQEVVG